MLLINKSFIHFNVSHSLTVSLMVENVENKLSKLYPKKQLHYLSLTK